jgi:glycosyltransferase involved in cell wall biosynthesis
MSLSKSKVLIVNRKPRAVGNFSLEGIMETLAPLLTAHQPVDFWTAPEESYGILPRIRSILALRKYLKYSSYEVVHVFGDVHFLVWGITNAKIVLTIHDIGFMNESRGLMRSVLKYFWLTGPLKKADKVVAVSEATKGNILQYFPKQMVEVIPTVISTTFKPREILFNKNNPKVLLLGTAENKNVERVLNAILGLSVHVLLVGKLSKEQHQRIKQFSYTHWDSCSFEEIKSLYHQSDLVMLCSTHEGFGMPILEAQATGRALITSNCSSMPEVAGKGALFVDPYNELSIRQAVINLVNNADLRAELIQYGYENTKRFDPKIVASQYTTLYTNLLLHESTKTTHFN